MITGRTRELDQLAQLYESNSLEMVLVFCKQYLWKLKENAKLPIPVTAIGSWWGYDKVSKKDAKIPILAVDDQNRAIIGDSK